MEIFTIRCTTCDAKLTVRNEELIGRILGCPKCGGMVLIERPDEWRSPSEDDRLPAPAESKEKAVPEAVAAPPDESLRRHEAVLPPPVPESLSESELRTRKILLGVLGGLLLVLILAVGILMSISEDRRGDSAVVPSSETVKAVETADRAKMPPDEPPSQAETRFAAQPAPESTGPSEASKPDAQDQAKALPGTPIVPVPDSEQSLSAAPAVGEAGTEPVRASAESATAESNRSRLAALLSRNPARNSARNPETTDETPATGRPDTETTPDSEPTIRSTAGLLSDLERKLPGLIEPSTALSLNIPDRLTRPLVALELNKTPLEQALRTLSVMTEIPMTLDVDEFRCRTIRIDEPLTGRFESMTIGEILAGMLAPLRLEPVVEERQITITVPSRDRDALLERTFDVSDLAEKTREAVDLRGRAVPDGALTAERLAEMLRRLVDPIGWAEKDAVAENEPSLRVEGSTLVLRHRLRTLDVSLRLLEQLRVLRGVPQTTEITGRDLAPEVFGWDAVEAPMTLHYYQPTLLSGVLEQLENTTGIRILVDHKALHRALSPFAPIKATVHCDRGTVDEALGNLLGSVDVAGLTYRILDAKTIEITTTEVARRPSKMTVEIHRYETPERLLRADETPDDLLRTIRTAVEPDSWFDPDSEQSRSETLGRGDIVVDRPSGCLIVRQSQPVQRRLRLWFGNRLAEKAPSAN